MALCKNLNEQVCQNWDPKLDLLGGLQDRIVGSNSLDPTKRTNDLTTSVFFINTSELIENKLLMLS